MNHSLQSFVMNKKIILVSIFGRLNWLAAELRSSGFEVVLIDVSEQMGQWPIEDQIGPFFIHKWEQIHPRLIERLNMDSIMKEQENGFCFWLPTGPVEFKGPLNQYQLSMLEQQSFLKEFEQNWGASSFHLPQEFVNQRSTYLRGHLFQRQLRRGSREDSFHWLKEKNVSVFSQSKLIDLAESDRNIMIGLELIGDHQGLFNFDFLIWGLTSMETQFLNEKLMKLFSQGEIESQWNWLRYRIQIDECIERKSLPDQTVIIQNLNHAMTHDNLIILNRTTVADFFDAWILLPTVQRFNKEYMTFRGQGLLNVIHQRMPEANAKIQTYPQEYYYTQLELGPPRFPVFDKEKIKNIRKNKFKNVMFDQSENQSGYLLSDQFENQQKIIERIQQMILKETKK